MNKRYILALDQGTTNCRSIVFDQDGTVCGLAQLELKQYFPKPGWVEHNPEDIWETQFETIRQALKQAGIDSKDVACIGITNQRETVVVWDRRTGKPIYNAIVWQDCRTANHTNALREEGYEVMVKERTGLLLNPFFSATKIQWILERVDGALDRCIAGDLAFGTIDTWLIYKLTGDRIHSTDVTNASRTMLLNINSLKWDTELLELFNISESMLPELVPSSGVHAHTHKNLLGAAIPISGIAGDQNSALLGQLCSEPGMVKNTYGTGCSIMLNTGKEPVHSQNGLLTTLAWKQFKKPTLYALEGNGFMGGSAIQWLRDGLDIIQSTAEVDTLAAKVPDSRGVFFVPAFVGLGAPYWDPHARGTLLGVTRGTTKAHICRATLEAIAHQTTDLLLTMQNDIGYEIEELRVDGGMAVSDMLLQIQANSLGIPIQRPKVTETTGLGAAYLAGLATGIWSNIGDITKQRQIDRVFEPTNSRDERESIRSDWLRAIERAKEWAYYEEPKMKGG